MMTNEHLEYIRRFVNVESVGHHDGYLFQAKAKELLAEVDRLRALVKKYEDWLGPQEKHS